MPTKPNKEEEIGSLLEKEFRIIVKMIQNFENKMELQINKLETRIEKMQEMFNKDVEEMSAHSSILAWRVPWTEEPGGLQSMGSRRVRHDCAMTNTQKK